MGSSQKVSIVLGLITLAVGSYAFFKGSEFGIYFPALLFGSILIAMPIIEAQKKDIS